MADNEFEFNRFRNLVLNADEWLKAARRLLASAQLLELEIHLQLEQYDSRRGALPPARTNEELGYVYFMLTGFALENLFKARIVRTQRSELDAKLLETHRLPKVLLEHNLVKLANRAGFSPTSEEEDLLRRLHRSSVWAGRYPAPMDATEVAMEVFSDGEYRFIDHLSVYDYPSLASLRDRILGHLLAVV